MSMVARALNWLAAFLLLLVTWPVVLAAALLVKLSSRGPAFFKQTRVGRAGKPFSIIKLRSMEHQQDCPQVWTVRNDPRVTQVGRVLRRYRIDELPQLINVLRGDMNLVGPRPEQPAIAKALAAELPRYEERHQVLPGITGLAQVELTHWACVEDPQAKLTRDLRYVRRRSVALDAWIMMRTARVVLSGGGSQ